MLVGVAVTLMIGFRFQVGGDWANYREMFIWYGYMDLWEGLRFGDPGYSLVNWVAHSLGAGIWFVNTFCAIIFTWGLVRFAGTQPNPWLTCAVAAPYLIIVVAMGYTRQAVAIGFIFMALIAFNRGSIRAFLAYMILAVTFHKTAVIVLPLIVASLTQNRVLLGGLLVVTAGMLYTFFLQGSTDNLITNYVTANYTSEGAAIRVSMNAVPAVVYLLIQRRLGLSVQERKMWRNFSLAALASVVALYVVASSTAVDRLALYLIPLQLVLLGRLPYIFSDSHRGGRVVVLAIILYSASIQYVWLNYATHARLWVPFKVYPVGNEDAAKL